MDYKEKVIALLNSQELSKEQKEKLENIFPELKESEDERVRKAILELVRQSSEILDKQNQNNMIAWLEKQDKQRLLNVPSREVILSIWDLGNEWKELTNGCISTEYGTQLDYIQKHWHESEYYLKEKQGKQTQLDYEHADILQKDFAPIEPKFKVGDWISGYYTSYKVMAINSKGYMVEDTDGNKINILFENEKFHHLFTIEDAKAGDVLVYETDEVEWIFIYREIVPAASEVPHDLLRYYFLLEGNYFNWNGVSAMITDDYKLYLKPATKEQQDTLFAKMKEAGYEWDSEKKELKKIEVKTLDANKVIEWLKNTIRENKIKFSEYNSIEDIINDFKEDFGLC